VAELEGEGVVEPHSWARCEATVFLSLRRYRQWNLPPGDCGWLYFRKSNQWPGPAPMARTRHFGPSQNHQRDWAGQPCRSSLSPTTMQSMGAVRNFYLDEPLW